MKVWLLIGTIDHEADLVFGVYADEGDADRECRRLEGLPYNERSYCNSFAVHEHEVIGAAERAARTAVSDPLLSAIIAASETSRLGPPTGVDAPRGCAPELYWRLRGVELVRATFYGRRAILGVAGDARCAGPIELEHVAHALNEAADRLAVRGLETIVVSGGGGTGGE